MRFTKMEGLGNDYIYLNGFEPLPKNLPRLALEVSRRRFGVGADGLVVVRPGRRGDFFMEMYNADGSQGEMCGNGIRCVGKYVYDKGLTKKRELIVETVAGPRKLELHLGGDGLVEQVTVDMGAPGIFAQRTITVEGKKIEGRPVSMGNPHFVLLCEDPAQAPVTTLGPLLERHPSFPRRTNVEFVSVENERSLHLRVWERGSGETLACGTGACASFAAARREGRCSPEVTVHLPGGALKLRQEPAGRHILMTGPARTVYEGELSNFRLTTKKG